MNKGYITMLTTGNKDLDRKFSGGIPEDTLLLLNISGKFPVDVFMQELVEPRKTLYIPLTRRSEYIKESFGGKVDILHGDQLSEIKDSSIVLENALEDYAEDIPEENSFNIVIDSLDEFENPEEATQAINDVQRKLDKDTVVFSYLLGNSSEIVKHRSNMILSLHTKIEQDSGISNFFIMDKNTKGKRLEESIKIEIGENVSLDTKRDI